MDWLGLGLRLLQVGLEVAKRLIPSKGKQLGTAKQRVRGLERRRAAAREAARARRAVRRDPAYRRQLRDEYKPAGKR